MPYCIEKDPSAPNFVTEAIKAGKVRAYCAGADAEAMNAEESKAVIMNRNLYY